MSVQDHHNAAKHEAVKMSAEVRQSTERSFRAMGQDMRNEMQDEVLRLGTQVTERLSIMGKKLVGRNRDQIKEVMMTVLVEPGSPSQARSATGVST
eukprot:augustus_masked-scaffold_27-processed-gene-4.71-mRNA-1 protein AED:1.00 eAED:1.00 QI:0/-1/0/0/-1/1/1/0/95